MSNQNKNALNAIGARKEKTTPKQWAYRSALGALAAVTLLVVADKAHDLPKVGAEQPPVADTGNNVIYPTSGRVDKILIKGPDAKSKGQEVVAYFAVDGEGFPDDANNATLSDFAYDVGQANGINNITDSESVSLSTQAINASGTGNQADGTGGNVEYNVPYYFKVSPETNLHELEVLAKQDDILVKPQ